MTISTIEAQARRGFPFKQLIGDPLWQRLVGRIVKDHSHQGIDEELAQRIINEALAFLNLCAIQNETAYGPSELVDIGWHTFILYTKEYAAFCDRVAGRFLHHNPNDEQGQLSAHSVLYETVAALREIGPVDEMLWADAANCNNHDCIEPGCDPTCSN